MRFAIIMMMGLGAIQSAIVSPGGKETYRVVVNAANPETTISTEGLSSLFLKNVRKWPDGAAVLPVDQSTTAPARTAFSKDVFDQPVVAIQSYWEDQIASGREGPPPSKASDAEVMAYVEANPGAVGYVSPSAKLPTRAKLLKVTR